MYGIKVINRLRDINREDWLRLNPHIFYDYNWFKTLEESKIEGIQIRYIIVLKGNKIVTILPFYIEYKQFDNTLRDIFGPYQNLLDKLGLTIDTILICGSPLTFSTELIISENHKNIYVLKILIKEIEKIARKEGISFYFFPYVSENDNFLLVNLSKLLMKSFSLCSTYLDVDFSSFDAYLSSLTKKSRNTIMSDIRKFKKKGIEIEEYKDISTYSSVFNELYNALYFKYHNHFSQLKTSFFANLTKNFRDDISVILTKKDNNIVAFDLYLTRRDTLYAYKYGSLIEVSKDGVYFNCHYESIKKAINSKIKRIDVGVASYKAKLIRGCKLEKKYLFMKSTNKIFNQFLRCIMKVIDKKASNRFYKEYKKF